jgi:hypothetical protein
MNEHTSHEEVRPLRSDRERVSDLLERYPRLSEREVGEIVNFLRNGPHIEIGFLTSNVQLRPKLEAFMEEHKGKLGVGFLEGAGVIAIISAVLAALWFTWEAFA